MLGPTVSLAKRLKTLHVTYAVQTSSNEEEDEEAGEREGKGEATASSVIAYFKIPII